RIVMWNKAAEAMYGLPREDAIGRNVRDLWPAADADRMHAADEELVATGIMQDFPDRPAKTRTRGDIRVHMRKVALTDAEGKATHVLAVSDDVTAQLADAARLRASESRSKAILEASLDCLIVIDHLGTIIEFNPAAEATFGIPRQQALGRSMPDLVIPPRLRDAHHRGFAHYLASGEGPALGKRLELAAIRADGTEFPIELSITPVDSGATPTFAGAIRDITASKQAAQDLRASETRFRSLTMLSSDWFWEQDAEHRFVAFSGGEGVKGWGPDQSNAVGMRRWDLASIVPISS